MKHRTVKSLRRGRYQGVSERGDQARHATGGKVPTRDPIAARAAAREAGGRGTSATPMSNTRRAAIYAQQRDSTGAHPCYQLTEAQSKRLRKKRNKAEGAETRLHVASK